MTEYDLNFLKELGETINREAKKNDGEYIAIIQKRKWLVGHPDFVDDWGLCVEGEDVAMGLNEAKKYLINYLLDENLDTLNDTEKAKILDTISNIRDIEEHQDLANFLGDNDFLYDFSFKPLQETWEIPDKGLKITFDIDEAKKYVSDKPNLRYELIYLGGSNPQMQQQGNSNQNYRGGYGNQNFHNASREAYGNDKTQDLDVDADKYDSDETIPF